MKNKEIALIAGATGAGKMTFARTFFAGNGKIIYEMPDGEIIVKENQQK